MRNDIFFKSITEQKLTQMAAEAMERLNLRIIKIILLPEKFLQFDWLRAELSQLNLKYLHVKYSYFIFSNQNHEIIS